MHVDRTRFLLLTASIASSSCAPTPTDTADDVPAINIEPSGDEPMVVERSSGTEVPTEKASDGRCRALKPGPAPHCESFDDTVADCERYADVLEPAAAQHASACLAQKSGTQAICNFNISGQCFVEAASKLPPVSAADQPCRNLTQRCAQIRGQGINYIGCRAIYSAVRPEQRSALETCIAEGCELASCFWSLEPQR
jgi:hypothetical protein